MWNLVRQRVEKRLAGQQKRYLSTVDGKCLLRVPYQASYVMSLFHAPMSVIEKLEKI